ncbi:ATP-dependent RNA helicase DDX51-like [Patiria miniata]|uniref:ATP-dependent RNA helicase n=1 Tax=Patiria miniata TaxID=46514 RepID=A0A913ZQH0_PATMI|nr:ATP-dependent RNA helicase DDX51-like [Patiria miniata]
MALFHMKRFMGGEESNFGENGSSESILKKLHEKAKARERQSHDRQSSPDKSKDKSHGKTVPKKSVDGSSLTESAKNVKKRQSQAPKNRGIDRKEELLTSSSAKKRKTGDVAESRSGKNKIKNRTPKKLSVLEESKLQSQKSGKRNPQKTEKVSRDDLHLGKQLAAATGDFSEIAQKNVKDTKSDPDESPVRVIKEESDINRSGLRAFRENAETAKKQKKMKTPSSASKLKSATIDADSNRTVDNRTCKLKDFKEDTVVLTKETPSKQSKACPELARNTLKNAEGTSPETRKQKKRKLSKVSDCEVKSEKHLKVSARTCEKNKEEDVSVNDTSDEFDGSDQSEDYKDCARALPAQEPCSMEDDSPSNEGSGIDVKQEEMDSEVVDKVQQSREVEMEEGPSITDDADEEREDEDEGTVKESKEEGEVDKAFALLGSDKHKKKQRVARVLPDWLAHPTLVEHDLNKHSIAVEEMEQLDPRLIRSLLDDGIKSLFPVQRHVIPVILDSVKLGIQAGDAGYRPRDLCVSAPTGSGKTLAFALPIVQALLDRVVPRIRALVVLPTRDLAQQVSKVFTTLCKGTDLRTSLIGGLKKFGQEQRMLVQTSGESQCDIVVATPGRLVDHINKTQGFTLQSLRFLVIDEADRMMDQISKDWISQVEKCVFMESRQAPGPITVETCRKICLPLQKLLFSATLSQNPEKLIQLNLFRPRLITSVVSSTRSRQEAQLHDGKGQERGEFVGKYTTPVGLTEHYIQCTSGEKPLVILHLIQTLNLSQILCFANTVESTHRLYHLIKLVGGIEVAEFSSNQTAGQRRQILKQFKTGKIQLLICSDAMARGMDVENAKYVISYDMPPYIKTYIHRVGRTARAGKTGVAFSLLQQYEVPKLLKLLKHAGKTGIQRYTVNRQDMDHLEESYEKALQRLPGVLRMEKAHSV